jgi:hypothetical protein
MAKLLLNCLIEEPDVEYDGADLVVLLPAVINGSEYVSLEVRLSPMIGNYDGTFELSFAFVIDDLEGNGLVHVTQDRYEVERYFDGLSREFVLPNVCEAARALIDEVQPPYIFRVTKGMNLPQKALAKHLLITEQLLGMGYQVVDQGTDQFRRLFWLLGR